MRVLQTKGKQLGAACALLLSLGSIALGGTKEEIIRLQKDILNMQTQVRELQKSIDESSGALKVQLEQLNSQAAKTNALLQSMKDALDLGQASQKATLSDLIMELKTINVRLDETHTRINSLAAQYAETKMQVETLKNPPRMLLATGDPSLPISPDQVYLAAYNDFVQGNYDVAIQGLQTYLAHFRDSELADNAQFYIGECYVGQKKYAEAVLSFDQVINLYPKGDKVAAAYLKKGLGLLELQKNEEAIEQFKYVVLNYPASPELHIARQQLELLGVNVDELLKKAGKKRGT